jgi:hypothetical protein
MEVKLRNKFLREGLEGNVIAILEEQKVYFLLKKIHRQNKNYVCEFFSYCKKIKMATRWASMTCSKI